MADSDMILAYIGKMLGQLGSTLGGNQQNLVNYGQQAAASNENLLADLHQKEYEEEKKKQEDKGLFGDLLNIGGTAASVAFPAAAPVILPATAAASGAVTGGVEGALAGGAKAALPQIANIPVSGGDGASAVSPSAAQPKVAPQTGGAASAQPANLGPDGMPKSAPTPAPAAAPESKSGGLFNTIFSDPRIQEQLSGIVDRVTTPSKPHLSTAGLYPETASNLRNQVFQQENADRNFQFDQQQAKEKNKYYQTQNELDRERLDIEKQKASRTTAVKPIDSGIVSLPDGSYARQLINPETNQVVNIPLGGSGEDAAIPTSLLPKMGSDGSGKFVDVGGAKLHPQDLDAQAQELISQGFTPVEAYTSIAAKIKEQMPVTAPQAYFVPGGQPGTGAFIPDRSNPSNIAPIDIRNPEQIKQAEEEAAAKKAGTERSAAATEQDIKTQAEKEIESVVSPVVTQEVGPGEFSTNKKDLKKITTAVRPFIDNDVRAFNGQVGRLQGVPEPISGEKGTGLRIDWVHPDGKVESIVVLNLETLSGE